MYKRKKRKGKGEREAKRHTKGANMDGLKVDGEYRHIAEVGMIFGPTY
jgi:hypothetical protein